MRPHVFHFLILVAILGIGVATFFATSGDPALQLLVGVLTAAAYVAWGILHHAIQGDLHPKVVVEYILIGAIAVILIVTLRS